MGLQPILPKTFRTFQNFAEEARSKAAERLRGRTWDEIFEGLERAYQAANDDDHPIGDQVVMILLNREFMDMLRLWDSCGRDMMLTKLTWQGK